MRTVETILTLLVLTTALAFLARKVNVPYPIVLVVAGMGLGFVPSLPAVTLDPQIVFLLFLPPILYAAGYFTSWRDFRTNLFSITLLAVGLVIATMTAVAAAVHALVPGIGWAVALVLGAIVSPPDAVAATAIAQRLHLPRQIVTILEGESLVNDATGLVLLKFATAAVVTGSFSIASGVLEFLALVAGGIAVGLAMGFLFVWVQRFLDEPGEIVVATHSTVIARAAARSSSSSFCTELMKIRFFVFMFMQTAPDLFSIQTKSIVNSVSYSALVNKSTTFRCRLMFVRSALPPSTFNLLQFSTC